MTFKEIREGSGMNMKQFSEHFEIPYRTIQNWEAGIRECPQYVLDLIKYRLDTEKLLKEVLHMGNKKEGEQE